MSIKRHKANLNRVVITGLGAISPLGATVEKFWTGLLTSQSGVRILTDIDLSHCRTKIGAQIIDFDANHYFSARDLQRLSKSSQFALISTVDALKDANLEPNQIDDINTGVILGASIGGFTASEPFFQKFFNDGTASPLTIPVVMNNAPASNISIRFNIKGPLITIDAACASSAQAIGYAYNLIRFGLLDKAVTGGSDSTLSPAIIQSWSSLRALSERNDKPLEACRPFSLDRDGIVLGEGAGILLLESESSAISRNAKIYAEITGYAATSDAHHLTQPSLEGVSEAMRLALIDANLMPNKIDYINAHATATTWNDKTETTAIKKVFGSHAFRIPVVGIKAAIGHSIAASGALELISCVLSIRDNIVPPTLNHRVLDPECDLDYVTEGKRVCDLTHIMSNSFAFGGSNAVLIISRYSAEHSNKSRALQLLP